MKERGMKSGMKVESDPLRLVSKLANRRSIAS
jgi:hypothetical protein